MMKRYCLVLFIVVAIVDVLSISLNYQQLHFVAKPMLVILLVSYYLYSIRREDRSNMLLFALGFSWLGDCLLLFEYVGDLFFVFGLLAFLVAHLCFMFTYQQHRTDDTTKALLGVQRFRFSFPIILAGTGLITVLYSHLGVLQIPVIIYGLALVVMVLQALFRFGRTSLLSFAMVFFGSTVFMISDSLIAINKFLMPIPMSGVWIMATYILAQYLIVHGLLMHKSVSS